MARKRRRRQNALRRAARAHVDVDARIAGRGGDHARHVAVADQHDARPRLAHLGDQLGMARPVEDADHEVGDIGLLGLGEVGEVLGRRLVEIDDALGQAAADGDLVHVDVGRIEEAAVLGHGDDGQRIGQALGGDGRALERIERDVDLGRAGLGQPDLLADIEHRRLVALALADHDGAVDGERVQRRAHGVDRGLVGLLLVATAHQLGGAARPPPR